LIEELDAITREQFMIERLRVMYAAGLNVHQSIHVKPGSEHVKLCAELLSSNRKLPSLREELPSFAENMSGMNPNISISCVRNTRRQEIVSGSKPSQMENSSSKLSPGSAQQ